MGQANPGMSRRPPTRGELDARRSGGRGHRRNCPRRCLRSLTRTSHRTGSGGVARGHGHHPPHAGRPRPGRTNHHGASEHRSLANTGGSSPSTRSTAPRRRRTPTRGSWRGQSPNSRHATTQIAKGSGSPSSTGWWRHPPSAPPTTSTPHRFMGCSLPPARAVRGSVARWSVNVCVSLAAAGTDG